MTKIKLTKINEYQKNSAMPIGYWLKGELAEPLKEESNIKIYREENCHGKSDGIFISSPVELLYENDDNAVTIHTRNSVYLLENV